MKRKIIIIAFFIVIVTGVVVTVAWQPSSPKDREEIQKPDYSIQLPTAWDIETVPDDDVSLFFHNEQGETIGGLVLLRVDTLADIGNDPEEVKSMRTENYKVYRGVQAEANEQYYCFYIPQRNTGYLLYFSENKVRSDVQLMIAKSVKMKLKSL